MTAYIEHLTQYGRYVTTLKEKHLIQSQTRLQSLVVLTQLG